MMMKFAPAIPEHTFAARNYNPLTEVVDCSKPDNREQAVIVILGEFETNDDRKGTADMYLQSRTGRGLTLTNMDKRLGNKELAQIDAWRTDISQAWRFGLILDHKQDRKI